MNVVFYISGHGLGHASRDIELIHTLRARRPDARICVRTAAPRWVFDAGAPPDTEFEAVETDTGIAQIDSLHLDEEATALAAPRFYHDFDRRVAAEAATIRRIGADVLVGDIPPLAF